MISADTCFNISVAEVLMHHQYQKKTTPIVYFITTLFIMRKYSGTEYCNSNMMFHREASVYNIQLLLLKRLS